jgi:8-oxo-dGTP diphosphatase
VVEDWVAVSGRRLVVAALLVDDAVRPRQVLAARRSEPAELRGRWEFPGGKVEPFEDPVAAQAREIREELGVSIAVSSELRHPTAPCWPISATLELRCWFARIVAGQPRALGSHDELRWLPVDGLPDALGWLDADRPIAALVQSRLLAATPGS